MSKDKLTQSLKKEYLLFKAARKKMHMVLENGFSSILNSDDFHFIDSDCLQALYLNTIEKGVGGAGHSNYYKSKEVELTRIDCQRLSAVGEKIDLSNNSWVYIIPTEWQLCGGILVSFKSFFDNFLELSYIMQDDFDMFDLTLNNSLGFRGDRSSTDLVYCKIISRGSYFLFIVDVT